MVSKMLAKAHSNIVVCVLTKELPPHINLLMSGSHSPFSVQVAELGPVSSSPGGQVNLIVLPCIGKLPPLPKTFGMESPHVDDKNGRPQLAIYVRVTIILKMLQLT